MLYVEERYAECDFLREPCCLTVQPASLSLGMREHDRILGPSELIRK